MGASSRLNILLISVLLFADKICLTFCSAKPLLSPLMSESVLTDLSQKASPLFVKEDKRPGFSKRMLLICSGVQLYPIFLVTAESNMLKETCASDSLVKI